MVEVRIMGQPAEVRALVEALRLLASPPVATMSAQVVKVRDVSRQCHNRSGDGVRVYADLTIGGQ